MGILETITFSDLSEMVLGGLLVILPLFLKAHTVRHFLVAFLPKTQFTQNFLGVLSIVFLGAVELLGVHLFLDPIVPGQGKILVYTATGTDKPELIEDLRVEIIPVQFNGQAKLADVKTGVFDTSGVYSTLVKFNCGEHRVLLRVYDQTQPSKPLKVKYYNVSPYVRVGLWDMKIYLNEP